MSLLVEWANDPWGTAVPIHVAFFLIWVAAIAALLFVIVHAIYVRYFGRPRHFAGEVTFASAAEVPERVPRHSLVARAFHWVMAAAMLTLLVTAFLPRLGIHFPWVTYHWIAGVVLTASILFHIVHASFWLSFSSIWPDRIDLTDMVHRLRRFLGGSAPPPRRFAKYPLENKLYHAAIVLAGLAAIATGVFMMSRVRTAVFPRNPYLLSDMSWGMIYVLHGLAGVGLIALIAVHIYFGLHPGKREITKAMIRGWMARDFYLDEHDPKRWVVGSASPSGTPKTKA